MWRTGVNVVLVLHHATFQISCWWTQEIVPCSRAFLAQSVERSPFKRVVAGSSPAEGIFLFCCASWPWMAPETCELVSIFETCIRNENVDGARMMDLAAQPRGYVELADMAMQYAGHVPRDRILAMAALILQRWQRQTSP